MTNIKLKEKRKKSLLKGKGKRQRREQSWKKEENRKGKKVTVKGYKM
jgi:hypothetical protein